MSLRTDYVSDVLDPEMNGVRRYKEVTNSDGTISLVDNTIYTQIGSNYTADDVNAQNEAINALDEKINTLAMSYVGMIIHSTTLDTMEKVIDFYGGTTWEKMEGVFLLGASDTYPAGSTGGEATHTLTVNEMPSHSHSYVKTSSASGAGSYGTGESAPFYNSTATVTTTATGGGAAHNNMPPYKTVYIWERTA